MKSIQFTTWLLSGLCTLAVASCQKNDPAPEKPQNWCGTAPSPVKVSYAQTQCADPWGQAASTALLQTVAKTYLAQRGITAIQLQAIVKNEGAVCTACTCPTGLVLEGTVTPTDLPAVLALGFTQQGQ